MKHPGPRGKWRSQTPQTPLVADIIERGGKQPPNPPGPPESQAAPPMAPGGSGDHVHPRSDRIPVVDERALPAGLLGQPLTAEQVREPPDRPRDLETLNIILQHLARLSVAEEKRVFAYLRAYADEHGL